MSTPERQLPAKTGPPGWRRHWVRVTYIAAAVGIWPMILAGPLDAAPMTTSRWLRFIGGALMVGGALVLMFQAGRLRERDDPQQPPAQPADDGTRP